MIRFYLSHPSGTAAFARLAVAVFATWCTASAATAQTGSSALSLCPEPQQLSVSFRFVETNNIRVHVAEAGEGPLVILVHGFPESWYSWRHQIPALASAGYRVVAPDMRGYGKTDRPAGVERYSIFEIAGDLVGLVAALGEEQAVLVGHDWGASAVMWASVLRPDIFRATVLLSVPYLIRRDATRPPLEAVAARAADGEVFYQVYFQDPAVTAELEQDVRRTLLTFLYSASGSAPPDEQWKPYFPRAEGFFSSGTVPTALPAWLREEDVEVFVRQFEHSGFDAPLNWYRNIDRDWRLRGVLREARLTQPLLFVAGDQDIVILLYRQLYDDLEASAPNLWRKVLLPGKGHWIQQEAPEEVNRLVLEFLSANPAARTAASGGVVPITAEPDHKIRFDNGSVRMYEVVLPPGRATLPHEHRADNFTVFFSTAPVTVEPYGGGEPVVIETAPGAVGFTSTAGGPYSHRVVAGGEETFRVIAMELLSSPPATSMHSTPRLGSAFEVVLENERGRAYRITLAPGESTGPFTRPAGTALFAVSAGRVSETGSGGQARLWDFEPAQFRWFDHAETLSLRNEGRTTVELVEIEVFRD
jgi:pimeloyl-ACP methyl ester carboxylesterase